MRGRVAPLFLDSRVTLGASGTASTSPGAEGLGRVRAERPARSRCWVTRDGEEAFRRRGASRAERGEVGRGGAAWDETASRRGPVGEGRLHPQSPTLNEIPTSAASGAG